MNVAVLIPPKDFRDETVKAAKLFLEKYNVKPVITSYISNECVGYHGAVYKPELNASKLDPKDFSALIIVNGIGVDSYKLYDYRPLLDLIRLFLFDNKIVVGIGNAIKVITRSNMITDVELAVPEDEETQRLIRIYRGLPSSESIVFSKNILTAKGDSDVDNAMMLLLEKLGAK